MTETRRFRHVPMRVLVLGGGVAGLETCLALRALAGDRVSVTLIAPSRYLVHRPVDVRDPLDVRRARVPVARLAGAEGVRHDRAISIDTDMRAVYTARGYRLPYDALVLAVGAVPEAVPARAEALDEDHTAGCRVLMHQVREGRIRSLAFVEPPAPARSFDLYDLAIDTAVTLRRTGVEADLTLVTSQPGPLAILGVRTAGALRHTLTAHALRVVESAYVRSIGYGEVELAPLSRRIAAERVIAAPRLTGPRLQHVPSDRDGFVPVDPHGRVPGVEAVFAAGDCTPFPVKHPSLAAQQADVVAAAIAADAGCSVADERFTPVLCGILPSRLRWYVQAPLTGGEGDATCVSAHPLWPPTVRFDARFLAKRLADPGRPARARGLSQLTTA
jgi:sulfide:quinone oxidoreductase